LQNIKSLRDFGFDYASASDIGRITRWSA